MSKRNATTKFAHTSKSVNRWDTAISDAERLIQEARDRITRLRHSIIAFKELRDRGEPFPGEKSGQKEAGA